MIGIEWLRNQRVDRCPMIGSEAWFVRPERAGTVAAAG